MKIAWIADFRDIDRAGGAQLTDRFLLHYANVQKKHQVVELNLRNLKKSNDFLNGFDLYIIANWVEIYQHLPGRNLLNYIADTKPFVRFVHDYDQKDNIPETEPLRKKLFANAKQVITLSPLHKAILRKLYPLPEKAVAIPPFIDDIFYDIGLRRLKDTVIGVGEIGKHKGIENVVRYADDHKNERFHFFTWNEVKEEYRRDNLVFYPAVYNRFLHLYFNLFDSFIHLPSWNEPFGRSVAEAYLSGCRMIINDKIGFFSYKWDYQDREKVRDIISFAPRDFWREVEKAI